jgi:leucyl-tRNA synthetase
MCDTGHLSLDEPFAGLFTQGMVVHETYFDAQKRWLSPADVQVKAEGGTRRAYLAGTCEEVSNGPVEKMSKSKKNTIDPDVFTASYGADTARWFMLSDSPPERDVLWTDEGAQGAWRFIQRLWRLVNEAVELFPAADTPAPAQFSEAASALRRAAHKALHGVEQDIQGLRFNRAIATIYDFTNTLAAALQQPGPKDDISKAFALKDSIHFLVHMMNPMMPHLAEECWARLGYNSLIANEPWPEADAGLLVDDTVTIAVQVNGKRRDEIVVARNSAREAVEAAALKLESVVRAIEGRPVKKVIVVPERIVNVVA